MNRFTVSICSFLFLFCTALLLSAQSDSPCNQGRSNPDPRNRSAICFPELGLMQGLITQCTGANSERFGSRIYPAGDVNRDGLQDWIIGHYRCDTIGKTGRYPEEIFLYKGVRGGLPKSRDGQRIGPTEIGSITNFLGAGDWDDDGNIDIATSITIYGDTIYGDTSYGTQGLVSRIAIFWGNPSGDFSLTDTTHLSNSVGGWNGPGPGLSGDFNHDGIIDLLVWNRFGSAVVTGQGVVTPKCFIYMGHHHGRWGRELPSISDWSWWNTPSSNQLKELDQDGDGVKDIVMYAQAGGSGTGLVSVLYGSAGMLPDTNQIETADLRVPNGHYALLSDVTDDRVPELLVHTGVAAHEERVKIYLGLKGQRLRQQFGSGNDRPDSIPGQWWGRPWSEIWMPHRVQQFWGESDYFLFDFGDGNLDGVGDLWAYSNPFLICYSGGRNLDSLVDGLLDTRPATEAGAHAVLGDIDGSGVSTYAVYGGNSVIYFQPSTAVPNDGIPRRLPQGADSVLSGVSVVPLLSVAKAFSIMAVPNPSDDVITVQWTQLGVDFGTIHISDESGREVRRLVVRADQGPVAIPTSGISKGLYFITMQRGSTTATTTVVVRH